MTFQKTLSQESSRTQVRIPYGGEPFRGSTQGRTRTCNLFLNWEAPYPLCATRVAALIFTTHRDLDQLEDIVDAKLKTQAQLLQVEGDHGAMA